MEEILRNMIPSIEPELLEEIKQIASISTFPPNTSILEEGAYIKVIPLVVKGQMKVFKESEDKELLLYYISPNESCYMSMTACLMNEASKVKAVTEEETEALLIPTQHVRRWMQNYPSWTNFIINLSKDRFEELLNTIDQISFGKLDVRLIKYLKEKAQTIGSNQLKITHQQIANELGSAREVISRLLKKMESEGEVSLARGVVDISSLLK